MRRTLDAAWSTGVNHFNLIRLVAAWLVIYSHAWSITGATGGDLIGRLTGFRAAGPFAVDVFFLVSGFLVAASFERNSVRGFLTARALRILPALWVCIALSVFVLGPIVSTDPGYWQDPRTWNYLWANASLWRAAFWLPGVFEHLPRTAVNGSLWTLPIEGRLYLALLLAGLCGMLVAWRYAIAWTVAMAVAAFYVWSTPLPEHLEALVWVTAFFITGTLLWLLRSRVVLSGWVTLAFLALAAMTRGGTPVGVVAYFAFVSYGTLWLAFAARRSLLRDTDVSYGLYLYGWPAQQVAMLVGAVSVAANIAVATALALACAIASWYLVERPALGLKRRWAAPLPATEPA